MASTKKPSTKGSAYVNTPETLKSPVKSKGPDTPREIDAQRRTVEQEGTNQPERKKVGANTELTTLFSKERYNEGEPLLEKLDQLRSEIRAVRREATQFSAHVESIDNATMQELPDRVGIYHVNFFDWLLQELKNLVRNMQEINDSLVWLKAARGKKAKRGVAGAQQAQSQELQLARSVG